jgi:hypothetical protein
MATYNGSQYTDFQNVNLKGSGTGSTVGFPNTPGALRIKFNGFASTVSIGTATLDQPFAISFPNKSGTMPVSGTFGIDLTNRCFIRIPINYCYSCWNPS